MTASLTAAREIRAPIRVRDPRTWRAALSAGVIALVLSAAGSWIPSFWGDEATSVMSAERSLPSLFRMLGNVDAVHGTYYFMLHYWVGAFGASPFSVRLPSAIATGIAVAGIVFLAERLAGYRVAVYAGLIALFFPRITYMGGEARSYAISAACAVWLTFLFVSLISRRDRRILPWAAYTGLLAVSGYVFLFSLLIVLAHGVILFAVSRDRWMHRTWAVATAIAVALAGPVLFYAIAERKQIAFLASRDALSPWNALVGQWFGNDVYAVFGWAIVAAAGVAAWRLHRSGRSLRRLSLPLVAATWALIPMIILMAANPIHPVYSSRYLTFAAPGAALLIGWTISRIPGALRLGRRRVPFAVLALLAMTVASVPTYIGQREPYAENNSDWAEISATIGAHARPGDAIVFDESTIPSLRVRLAEHAYPQDYTGLDDVMLRVPYQDNTWWWDGLYHLDSAPVTARLASVHRLWLVEYRAPAERTDRYGIARLHTLGFHVIVSYKEHASTVYELQKP